MVDVYGWGNKSSGLMFIGEAPGQTEARLGRPFVGASGKEQVWYLSRYGFRPDDHYLTNVVKSYIEGNPDPSADLIKHWTPTLIHEIEECEPKLIVAVGRFAAQWFLGPDIDMESIHGLPRQVDFTLWVTPKGSFSKKLIVLPVYHPAFGLYSPKAKSVIDWDYSQVAATWRKIQRKEPVHFREDAYAGKEQYHDVTGYDLATLLAFAQPHEIGLDTEGIPSNPWSIQVSYQPGEAYTLRISQPDFHVGIQALQSLVDQGCLIITHDAGTPSACLYDTIMCRAMGLELSRANLWNTMYAAYLLRIESKALKVLAYRWCGMQMEDYMSLVSDIGKQKQTDYLIRASERKWSKPEPYIETLNNGEMKLKRPKSINVRIEKILVDILADKRNKDDEEVDPLKRWRDVDPKLRAEVERELGPMPVATLDDVELDKAVYYAGRDPDATLRLKRALEPELKRLELI